MDKEWRRERRKARLAMIGSAIFIVAGGFALISGQVLLGMVTIVFFAAVFLIGLLTNRHKGRPPVGRNQRRTWAVVMTAGCLLMGVACALLYVAAVTGHPVATSGWRSPNAILIAGAIGAVFFGGGGIFMAVRLLRGQRRDHH